MSVQVKHRREAAAFLATFVGAQGELIVDTTNNRVQVHDGSTPGGFPAAKLSEIVSVAGFATNGANANITSLSGLTTPLSIGQGGTGANTAATARGSISAAGSGANSDITSLVALTTPLSIGQGGTGGSTAVTARGSIGAAASGANSDITTLSALASINGGPLSGFRNRVRNANFAINQRGVSGTVTLAAGAYGHDGVKAGSSGATYTFAVAGIDTVLTITAGSVILPIESVLVEGGSYTLSWGGTATGRVYQGSTAPAYGASPLKPTGFTGATQVSLEFTAGTLSLIQFEPGTIATTFERHPFSIELGICQRYYQNYTGSGVIIGGYLTNGTTAYNWFPIPLMRAAPTVVLSNFSSSIAGNLSLGISDFRGIRLYATATATGGFYAQADMTLSAEL